MLLGLPASTLIFHYSGKRSGYIGDARNRIFRQYANTSFYITLRSTRNKRKREREPKGIERPPFRKQMSSRVQKR